MLMSFHVMYSIFIARPCLIDEKVVWASGVRAVSMAVRWNAQVKAHAAAAASSSASPCLYTCASYQPPLLEVDLEQSTTPKAAAVETASHGPSAPYVPTVRRQGRSRLEER